MSNWYRKYQKMLTEGVSIHPATVEIEDGQKVIGFPSGFSKTVEKDCGACDGTGKLDYGVEVIPCNHCDGGKYKTTIYEFPELDVGYRNFRIILMLLGYTYEEAQTEDLEMGYVPYEKLPEIKRQLIKMKNTDTSGFTFNTKKTGGETIVDKSDDVPRIRKTAIIYEIGVTQQQVDYYIDKMLEIVDWAQKRQYGLSWA